MSQNNWTSEYILHINFAGHASKTRFRSIASKLPESLEFTVHFSEDMTQMRFSTSSREMFINLHKWAKDHESDNDFNYTKVIIVNAPSA